VQANGERIKAEAEETAALCELQLMGAEYNKAREQFYKQDQADIFNVGRRSCFTAA